MNQYVQWSSDASIPEHFFSDATCRELYKRNALNMILRTNTFNGRRYRDDPTILSWVRIIIVRRRALPDTNVAVHRS